MIYCDYVKLARFLPLVMGCVGPEALQAVELALILSEDMDDDPAVVEQHPIPKPVSFDADFAYLLLAKFIYNALRDGLNLAVGLPAAYYKIIGDYQYLADIDDYYVTCLLIGCRSGGYLCNVFGFQFLSPFNLYCS